MHGKEKGISIRADHLIAGFLMVLCGLFQATGQDARESDSPAHQVPSVASAVVAVAGVGGADTQVDPGNPLFLSLDPGGQTGRLHFIAKANRAYFVEQCTDLLVGDWVTIWSREAIPIGLPVDVEVVVNTVCYRLRIEERPPGEILTPDFENEQPRIERQ